MRSKDELKRSWAWETGPYLSDNQMKTYNRNKRFWEQTRLCFLTQAQLWSRGSESHAMVELAHSENWDQFALDNAPASRKTSPQDLAVILLNRFLS